MVFNNLRYSYKEKEAYVARKLTAEEVQVKFLRWGEGGVQDTVLRNEFADVPSEDLQAILEAGMQGDDHWLRQDNDQWFLVDFAGMNRTCALRTVQTLIANKLLPVTQKPKPEDLDNFTTEDLWRFADLYEFAIACFMDAMHQDPNHEVNRPYRELKKRFDALESNNAKLLQEKQQAVADLAKANGEVARLKDDLAKKPVPADAATVSQEDLAVLEKAKALVAVRPDLTPELLKQILGENTGLKQEVEAAKGEAKKAKKQVKKAAAARSKWRKIFIAVAVVVVIVAVVVAMNGKGISLPSLGDGDSGLKDQLEQLK